MWSIFDAKVFQLGIAGGIPAYQGRFDFEAVNSDDRLGVPLVRDPADDQQLIGTEWGTALGAAADAAPSNENASVPVASTVQIELYPSSVASVRSSWS